MSRIKAGINIAKAGKTKISELVKKIKRRKYAKTHRENKAKIGRSDKSVSRYNIRAKDQNVTVIPTKGQSQKGSSFRIHKLRGNQSPASIRSTADGSAASWRDEMDRMFGEIPIETFFKKKSKGGINTIMNKKYLTGGQAKMDKNNNGRIDAQDFKILKAEKAKGRGQGLQDEKVKPGKVMKAKTGSGLDLPVINRVKINKKSLHKNLMKGKNPYSDLVKTTEKGPKSFLERRKELGGRALRAAKATKYGKIAAGVAGVGLAAKAYLNKKLEKAKAKRKAKGKMGGGMMQRPMGYGIGGGVSRAKEHKKIIKDKAGSLLGYVGEMAKTISRATPVGAAQEAGKKVVELVKSKKEQRRNQKKRFDDRVNQMPRPKYERLPLDPNNKPTPKRMPGTNQPPKYRKLNNLVKPRKAALGMLMLGRAAKKDKKMIPGGIGITAAKASAIKKILGMRTGQMVKARGCKLGRSKPTKLS